MDYKKEMSESRQTFFEFYTERMIELEQDLEVPSQLSEELQKKRDFGYEKYGEYSFQSNFENALASPTAEHLREEFVDAINYALHEIYKSSLYMRDDTQQREFLRKLLNLYDLSFEVF